MSRQNRYQQIITKIFLDHYYDGASEICFERSEIAKAANELGINPPKNLGDVVYSQRYRSSLPPEMVDVQPDGLEWIIEGIGRSRYAFRLVRINRITPRSDLDSIKIPDATPSIINAYALSDEQALLAKVRYNRLVDIFLGITSYSLQNHLRTTVKHIGQIEIDEIYVGIDSQGIHYVIPVQAKVGNDQLSVVQTRQDIAYCQNKPEFQDMVCRPVSAQLFGGKVIALFELVLRDDGYVSVIKECHYELVSLQ